MRFVKTNNVTTLGNFASSYSQNLLRKISQVIIIAKSYFK